jgi:hypothetical protein
VNLPDDLKDFTERDAFQIIEESDASMGLCIVLILAIILEPILR